MFEFAKNTELDNLDSVPENFRVFYKEREGGEGYALDSENPVVSTAVASIAGLGKSLKAARSDADRYRKDRTDLSALSEYGDSPESIKSAVDAKLGELQEQLQNGESAKIDLEKIKEDLAKSHNREVTKKEQVIEGLKGQLYAHLVTSEATTAIAAQKGVSELLMPFVKERVKVVEEEGQLRVFVVDGEGNRRYSGATGEAMTIPELVSEMKGNEQYGRLFESEAPSGTSAVPPSPSGRRVATPKQELSSVDKISAGLRQGQFVRPGQG